MKDRPQSIRKPSARTITLVASCSLLAGPVFGQMFDPSLADGPRVSPLPLYYEGKGTFHKNLFSLADSGLHLQFLDAFVPAETQPLLIKREYRSGYDVRGVFGIGWVSNLDVRVEFSPEKKDLRIFEANGKRTDYEAENGSANYAPVVGTFLKSKVVRSADGHFVREWENGFRETFDSSGRRESIVAGNDKISFLYQGQSAKPARISDALGRKFELTYSGELITALKDPLGRKTQYRYDGQRLVETTDSIGRKDVFKYDNGKLSALTLPRAQRLEFSYTPDHSSLAQISGPGAFKTSFVWRSETNSPGRELVMTYGNGSTETIQFGVGSVEEEKWKPAKKDDLTPADRLGFELKQSGGAGGEMSSLVTNDQIYVRSGRDVFALNGKGVLKKADQIESEKLSSLPLRKELSTTGPVWRSRITPAFIPPKNGRIKYNALGRATTFQLDTGKVEAWTWDEADRVSEWTDRDGMKTRYDYDSHNNLVGVIENNKPAVTFEYNEADLLVSAKDAAGGWNRYEYDGFGNCIAVHDETGTDVRLEYDLANRLRKYVSGEKSTVLEYDSEGRTSKVLVSEKPIVSYTYDVDGRIATETDALGLTSTYAYDGDDRITSVRRSDNSEDKVEYGEHGYSVVSASSHDTKATREYDQDGRLTRLLQPDGLEVRYEYDERGLPIKIEDSSGATLNYEYNALGRIIGEQTTDGRSRKWEYDGAGRPNLVQDGNVKASFNYSPDGGQSALITDGANSSRIDYDKTGRPIKKVDPAGQTTEYEYDRLGLLKSIKSSSGILSYEHDSDGRLTKITRTVGSTSTSRSLKYDAKGSLVESVFEDGTTEAFTYDDLGTVTSMRDPVGNVYSYRYNAKGEVESVTSPYGEQTFKYDGEGRLVEKMDSAEGTRHFDYLFEQVGAQGELAKNFEEVTLVDQAGQRTNVKLDKAGRPMLTTDALGGKIAREYDIAGNLIGYTDPNGNRLSYKYDVGGRLIERRSPEGKISSCRYDGTGNRVATSVQGGVELACDYDQTQRLQSVRTSGKELWNYNYDKAGLLSAINGQAGKYTYERDELGRLTAYTDLFGKKVGFSYDAPGSIGSRSHPGRRESSLSLQ